MSVQHKSKQELARQIERARASTASAGKFTSALRDEPVARNRGKKHKV